jgi:hypothetical protein
MTRRRDDEGRERDVRDTTAYGGGSAWLAVLLAGLAVACGLLYAVYRTFAGYFSGYDG